MTQGNQFILLWTLLTVLGTLAAMFTFWGFLVFLPIVVFVLQSLLLFAYMEPKNGIIWWLNIGCVLLFFEFKDDMFLMFVLMAVLGEVVFSLAFSRFSFLMWSLIYVAGFSLFHFLLPSLDSLPFVITLLLGSAGLMGFLQSKLIVHFKIIKS